MKQGLIVFLITVFFFPIATIWAGREISGKMRETVLDLNYLNPMDFPDDPLAERLEKYITKDGQLLQFIDPITGMKFVYVKGGCYQMGDIFGDGNLDERPVHKVCVDGFYMGKYEVTQREYKKIIGSNPPRFKKGSSYPVEEVSWNDAQDFIRKLNSLSGKTFRLPTEAEWEYAARSGGKRDRYSGGNSPDSVAWYTNNSGSSTHPVGRKSPNGLGIYDMSGNVWEWCSDWYNKDYYSSSPRNNPQGPWSGSARVDRGGCWDNDPRFVRSAFRYGNRPDYRLNDLGFRLILSEGS